MLLELQHVTKKFRKLKAVDDLSFSFSSGEIVGLLGPNGAGKTTTIRLIATLLTPDSGQIVVDGFDTLKAPEKVRSVIGVLTTEIGVYERFSGREHLQYFGSLYGLENGALTKRITELITFLDMANFIDRKAGEYSTGMKQKLAIARSVIHDPKIIIFDEPTAGLDVLASQTVLAFMQQSQKLGHSVIFSTHHLHEAENLCQQVIIMHQGTKLTSGKISTILKNSRTKSLEEAFLKLVNNH